MKFLNDGSTDTIEFPAKTMNDILSFTYTLWLKVE